MNRFSNHKLSKILKYFSVILFFGCLIFLVYYLGIQPFLSRQVQNKYKDIYYNSAGLNENENLPDDSSVSGSNGNGSTSGYEADVNETSEIVTDENGETIDSSGIADESPTSFSIELDNSVEQGSKNSKGILKKFEALRKYNKDVRGWLKIEGTNIDYPVMQNPGDSEFYLHRNFEGNTDKNGSLFLDGYSDVKTPTKNLVIHGHNMKSTGMMFYQLMNYNDLQFYKEHPVISFDSIYEESKWLIIGFMRVSGDFSAKGSFNYLQSGFETEEDFLNFVYEIKLRSVYTCPVDVNENDSLLMLSTCSYEADNYRAVVVARKLRDGEEAVVNTGLAKIRKDVLYPDKWYSLYDGEPPIFTTFIDALAYEEISWYDGEIEVDKAVGSIFDYKEASYVSEDGFIINFGKNNTNDTDKISNNSDGNNKNNGKDEKDGNSKNNIKIASDGKYEITSSTTAKYIKPANNKMTEIIIPDEIIVNGRTLLISEIDDSAFERGGKICSIRIGNNVEKIPAKTFLNCTDLESVIIGKSVTSIGKKAFYKLENLKKIKILSDKLDSVGEKAFDGIGENAVFKFPKGKEKKYKKMI